MGLYHMNQGYRRRRFCQVDPVPSLDWLESLSDQRYLHIVCRGLVFPAKKNK